MCLPQLFIANEAAVLPEPVIFSYSSGGLPDVFLVFHLRRITFAVPKIKHH